MLSREETRRASAAAKECGFPVTFGLAGHEVGTYSEGGEDGGRLVALESGQDQRAAAAGARQQVRHSRDEERAREVGQHEVCAAERFIPSRELPGAAR